MYFVNIIIFLLGRLQQSKDRRGQHTCHKDAGQWLEASRLYYLLQTVLLDSTFMLLPWYLHTRFAHMHISPFPIVNVVLCSMSAFQKIYL